MLVKEILEWLKKEAYDVEFTGNVECVIQGFSSLNNYKPNTITWIKKIENVKGFNLSAIACAVTEKGIDVSTPNQIFADNSKDVFFAILCHFWGESVQEGFVGKGTVITDDAIIHPSAYIGYNCSIIGPVKIGAHTIIENNVVIQGNVSIGKHCYIQSEVVIGIDGFGFSKNASTGTKKRIEHFGGVQIGNDVFIASHVNIARGTIDDTIIADGVKIAPSTHIEHNNHIDKNATIICSLLFGSVHIGKDAYITASTIQNQLEVGEHTVIGMGSVVTRSISDNVIAFGIPAKTIRNNDTNL